MLERLRSRRTNLLATAEQRCAFNQRYTRWCDASRAALPDDLRARFEQELAHLLPAPDPNERSDWSYYMRLPYAIEEQSKQLFLTRRRLWQPSSSLPKEVRSALAAVFRKSYEIYTIEKLFVDSGCEQHWYIPTATPDKRSKALNTALGWLDGILLHAPEQERAILYQLCEAILANPRLTAENREQIEEALPLIHSPAPIDPLASYNLHPTVHDIATPLLAINHNDEAILKVCIALNNQVQHRVNRPDLDGSKLMQQVFSPGAPMITLSTDSTEQQGWMQLFTGAIQALRNPRAHKLGQATSREVSLEWLTFLSALFRTLDNT